MKNVRIIGLALILLGLGASAEAAVPAGFQESSVYFGVNKIIDLDWDPSGDIWFATQTGDVWILRSGGPTLAASIPVSLLGGESGLISIAIDPDYANNQRVWFYYMNPGGTFNRLSHYTNLNDSLVAGTTIVEIPQLSTAYNGGCVHFLQDGTMFLSTGFDGDNNGAEDPFSLKGKLLRVHDDGSAPLDNPFFDGAAADPRVWSMGLRNPFRCGLQPTTDLLFIGDVGPESWEEINVSAPGADFGYPALVGPTPPDVAGKTYPLFTYPRPGFPFAAVIGGAFATPGDFSPVHLGDYFFGDYKQKKIYRMQLNASNEVVFVDEFATQIVGPSSIKFGPDGALYYVSYELNEIRKIEFLGGTGGGGGVTGLTFDIDGSGDLTLAWNASCLSGDTDYAVFEGSIPNFGEWTAKSCTTTGLTSRTITPDTGDSFYLVAPHSGVTLGSYGRDSSDNERLPLSDPCLAQALSPCP